jgi:hypothetical protein
MNMKKMADQVIEDINTRMDNHKGGSRTVGDDEIGLCALTCRIHELELSLQDAKLFANWVECLGRTDCEIYKHELKASADLAIERINKVLGG